MADIKPMNVKLPALTKTQKDGLAEWAAKVDKPLEDESADALWGAGLASKAVYKMAAPATEAAWSKLMQSVSMPMPVGVK